VHELPGVFFEVDPVQPDAPCGAPERTSTWPPVARGRSYCEIWYPSEVRVEIVLAREDRGLVHRTVRREGDAHGKGHHLALITGRTPDSRGRRADGGVRLGPEDDGQPQNALLFVRSWQWTFEPDHGLKRGSRISRSLAGRGRMRTTGGADMTKRTLLFPLSPRLSSSASPSRSRPRQEGQDVRGVRRREGSRRVRRSICATTGSSWPEGRGTGLLPERQSRGEKKVVVRTFESNAVDATRLRPKPAAEYAPDFVKKWLGNRDSKPSIRWRHDHRGTSSTRGTVGRRRASGGLDGEPRLWNEVLVKDPKGTSSPSCRHKSRRS